MVLMAPFLIQKNYSLSRLQIFLVKRFRGTKPRRATSHFPGLLAMSKGREIVVLESYAVVSYVDVYMSLYYLISFYVPYRVLQKTDVTESDSLVATIVNLSLSLSYHCCSWLTGSSNKSGCFFLKNPVSVSQLISHHLTVTDLNRSDPILSHLIIAYCMPS